MNHIFDHPLINTKNHESNQNTKSNALHEEATQEKKLPGGIVDNQKAQSNVNVTQSTYGHHNTSAGGNHVHGDVNYNFYNNAKLLFACAIYIAHILLGFTNGAAATDDDPDGLMKKLRAL